MIPTPEAFVLHKMIINSERKNKIEKDQNVINKMYKHLNVNKFNLLKDNLTKKEIRLVKKYIDEIITPMLEQEAKVKASKDILNNT